MLSLETYNYAIFNMQCGQLLFLSGKHQQFIAGKKIRKS